MKINIENRRMRCMTLTELHHYYMLNPDKRLKIKHKKGAIDKIDIIKLEEVMKMEIEKCKCKDCTTPYEHQITGNWYNGVNLLTQEIVSYCEGCSEDIDVQKYFLTWTDIEGLLEREQE